MYASIYYKVLITDFNPFRRRIYDFQHASWNLYKSVFIYVPYYGYNKNSWGFNWQFTMKFSVHFLYPRTLFFRLPFVRCLSFLPQISEKACVVLGKMMCSFLQSPSLITVPLPFPLHTISFISSISSVSLANEPVGDDLKIEQSSILEKSPDKEKIALETEWFQCVRTVRYMYLHQLILPICLSCKNLEIIITLERVLN